MDEVASKHQKQIGTLSFVPTGGGQFEVTVNGELIFSKLESKRFPEPGEVAQLLADRLAR